MAGFMSSIYLGKHVCLQTVYKGLTLFGRHLAQASPISNSPCIDLYWGEGEPAPLFTKKDGSGSKLGDATGRMLLG
jgi:hypothetical protein